MRGGGHIRLVAIAAFCCGLAACDIPSDSSANLPAPSIFGGVSLKAYPERETLRPGTLYRTIKSGTFSSLEDLRPICTLDTEKIAPVVRMVRPQFLSDFDRYVMPGTLFASALLRVDYSRLSATQTAPVIEGVHFQMSGMYREFIEESEVARLYDKWGLECWNVIRGHLAKGLTVFLVDGVVTAANVKITARYSEDIDGIDVGRISVNGIRAQSVDKKTTTHIASNVVVEVFIKTIGYQ